MTLIKNEEVFIILHPGKERRMLEMLFTLAAGISLIAVSFISYVLMQKPVLLHMLSMPFGIYVVWYAWMSFLKPHKKLWPETDTLRNLAGFIIIAHASGMFAGVAGFQWSHLFILIGAAVIFMGVMFPKEKYKCGFTINENVLIIKSAKFRKATEIDLNDITDVLLQNSLLIIRIKDNEEYRVNLNDFDKLDDSVNELKEMIKLSQHPS